MTDAWTDRWNQRYAEKEFAYSEESNIYLKEQLNKLDKGKILFIAESEGRNAIYVAKLGWNVIAFDISHEGQKKAVQLAEKNNVSINYSVGELNTLAFNAGEFDAVALIYAHFPVLIKSQIHKSLDRYLSPGGTVIFEAFSKNHFNYLAKNENVGGPRDVASLFLVEEILADFGNYQIVKLNEVVVDLNEGLYHNGEGSVIRFFGRKL